MVKSAASVAMAIAAHPDDIEFLMAGTLRRLAEAGWQTHYLTLANGSCGSLTLGPAATARLRAGEARAAARILGARFHPSLTPDCTILYGVPLLRRVAAIVRAVGPRVLLVPSPQDYMEDHTETCRLAVTAAFVRGMPNFRTTPSRRPVSADVTIYHEKPEDGRLFTYPRYVIKSGEIVVEDGDVRATIAGREFICHPAYDEEIEEYLRQIFPKVYTISFENYPVEIERLRHAQIQPCP